LEWLIVTYCFLVSLVLVLTIGEYNSSPLFLDLFSDLSFGIYWFSDLLFGFIGFALHN